MNIKEIVIKYWKELIILFLFIVLIVFMILNKEKQDKIDNMQSQHQTQQTIDSINGNMPTVTDHETNVYPKIDAQLRELNKNIKYLSETVKRLEANRPTKEDSYAIFQNQSTSQISRFFNDRGFNNTIYNLPSK